ncbi:MAG: SMP-30/gluconolactonase/LRE family protein [Bacteroidales bacterium]|nr:SMP-30/gluconolactonase/LRE family protein [Bacteroidales bacterium]
MKKFAVPILACTMLSCIVVTAQVPDDGIMVPGAKLEKVADGFTFTEGVASDTRGHVYFSDIPASRIHYYDHTDQGKIFLENSNRANGLHVDQTGNIIACEGAEGGRLVQVSPEGGVSIIAEGYDGKSFNSPNDLWESPNGGFYMTDPRYGRSRDNLPQDGEHVYYITRDRKKVVRVTDDLVRPNGVTGSVDGSILYVADPGSGKTYRYTILKDGTLTDKQLFADEGSDGMTIDSQGNVYLTNTAVKVYNPAGRLIETIEVPESPTNVAFGGKNGKTLYITARTSVYKLEMRVEKVFSN